ncbi:MAG: hypothetical protein HY303_02830, partial [Candidatus Wallbacteria bacterium]|nr:hypothetical protein [Candidatus Wallbacteria bacterium]
MRPAVQLAFTVRGHTVSGTVRFSIQPARSGVTGLALSPSAVTIAAGSRYGLRANVEVTASFDDGTTRAVSNGVEWVEPVGGRVLSTAEGAVFAPLAGSGTAFVKARYSSGGFTRSATLALDIVQPLPAKAQLVLRPALVALAPGVSLDLPANVQAVLRAEDGSEQQVTREVHWLYPVGGELRRTPSGIAFEAAGDGSDGSVLAVYAAPSQALSARLPIAISEVSRTSRSLGEATVGQPLVLALTERSPRLASGPLRASTAALETAGLQL